MAKLMETQRSILKHLNLTKSELISLVLIKGQYLRQLANLVNNGTIGTGTAARLLINY